MSKITTTQIKNKNSEEPQTTEESVHKAIGLATHWINRNSKVLILCFFGFLSLCALYFLWSMLSKERATKNFEKSYKIEIEVNSFIKSTNSSDSSKDKTSSEESKNIKDKESQLTDKVIKFISVLPSHGASRNLALKWSSHLYDKGQYEQAYKVLSQIKIKKSSSLFGLVALSKATNLFKMQKHDQSIDTYKSIIRNKQWKFIHSEARYRMSLSLVKKNSIDQAIENLKILSSDEGNKGSVFIQESKTLLRWLQYQKSLEKKKPQTDKNKKS